jgi:cytochrome c
MTGLLLKVTALATASSVTIACSGTSIALLLGPRRASTAAPISAPRSDSAAAAPAGPLPPLVAVGQYWWARSPDPENPVACATCHDDPALVRPWAASFPKFRPLPPPHARVMTLLQANAEAVARHYRVAEPRPLATAITAYLTWLAEGLPVTPGVSAGQPVFDARLRQLARSTARGRALYATRCAGCHDSAHLAAALGHFPRVAERDGGALEALESFLEGHEPAGQPLPWDGQDMADLVAYLVSRAASAQGLGRAPR